MMDAGIVVLCKLENTAPRGQKPKEELVPLTDGEYPLEWSFKERIVGMSRQYEAKGVNERVDMVIRTWRNPARIGMYAVLSEYEDQENEEGDQYRIDNVQHLYDDDGLKVTDLTLYRLDKLYDVNAEETEDTGTDP